MWQKITFKSIAWKWKSWCIEIIAIKKIFKIEIIKKENHLKARTSYHLHLHWVVYRSIKHDAIWDCYQKHFVLETLATFGPTVIQNAFSILDKRKRAAVLKVYVISTENAFLRPSKNDAKTIAQTKKKGDLGKILSLTLQCFSFLQVWLFSFLSFYSFLHLKNEVLRGKNYLWWFNRTLIRKTWA